MEISFESSRIQPRPRRLRGTGGSGDENAITLRACSSLSQSNALLSCYTCLATCLNIACVWLLFMISQIDQSAEVVFSSTALVSSRTQISKPFFLKTRINYFYLLSHFSSTYRTCSRSEREAGAKPRKPQVKSLVLKADISLIFVVKQGRDPYMGIFFSPNFSTSLKASTDFDCGQEYLLLLARSLNATQIALDAALNKGSS